MLGRARGENPPGAKTRDTLHTRVTGHTGLLAARVTVCHSDALMIRKAQRGGGRVAVTVI